MCEAFMISQAIKSTGNWRKKLLFLHEKKNEIPLNCSHLNLIPWLVNRFVLIPHIQSIFFFGSFWREKKLWNRIQKNRLLRKGSLASIEISIKCTNHIHWMGTHCLILLLHSFDRLNCVLYMNDMVVFFATACLFVNRQHQCVLPVFLLFGLLWAENENNINTICLWLYPPKVA